MFSFEAIGTHWNIEFYEDLSAQRRADLLKQIEISIAEFDRRYSRFRDDSLVMEMAKNAGRYSLPGDAYPMMHLYERLYRLTDGLFTPLIGQTLVEAGYDAYYSLQPKELHTPPAWDDVMEYHSPTLLLKQPALLDFGAIGKGYLIDIIADLLTANGIRRFCIDAGGDLLHRDTKSLRVGLEDPRDFQRVIGVATIRNQSLCGSSGSRRRWDRFHHILNPRTLHSPEEVIATWTVAETTMLADALATCLFLVDPERLKKVFLFEYVVLFADGRVSVSSGFSAEMFVS